MPLSFGLSPWLLLLCLLGAAGLTYWTYRGTVPPLPVGRRLLLGGLRFAALFIVLLLLFEPIWRRVERTEEPPLLAVLVDDSESLSLTASRGDSATLDVAAEVRRALDALPADRLGGEARVFAFSREARPLPARGFADSLQFSGARTDIAAALDRVRDELGDENLRGVLLVSDGRYNAGRNPLYAAERYPVPIYTAVVGDTTQQRDLQVRRVTTNEIAYLGTEQPVQVGVRTEGFGGESVMVSLLQEGQVLSQERVTLPEGTAEVVVDLAYTPEAAGLQRYTVATTRLDGEATYRNNEQAFSARVLEQRKRLLLVGAAPTPDVGALRQTLAGEDVEVVARVQKAPDTFYEGALPADLDAFDALVLAGYPGRTADAATMQRLASAVEDGLSVLFVLNRQTDTGLLGEFFGDVLPAQPEVARPSFVEATFVPTPEGARHPILDLPDADEAAWRRLPPLLYNEGRWAPSPDARVLATTEVRGIALGDPLFVVRQRGRDRSAALLGGDVWRWRNLPQDLDRLAPLWPGLLQNTVQWITTREDDRPVRVQPVQETFASGEAAQFSGQAYDESLQPVPDAAIAVTVTAPDGTEYPFNMTAEGGGRYTLDAGTLPEGTYRYTAAAERGGVALGEDSGTFSVGGLTVEFRETTADAALMRQIASRSGGVALAASDVEALPAALAASGAFTASVTETEQETRLWHLYGLLALVVVLLAAEWFFRKRSGLV